MQTARVTILMTPDRKAAFDALAAERGLSTGEFFRRAGDREAVGDNADKEALLAALTDELEASLPEMRDDFDASLDALRSMNDMMEAYRAEKAQARPRRAA